MILKQRLKKFLKENSRQDVSFTLIELVLVIGILAILAVVVILAINPSEFLKQSRDSSRMTELKELNKAILLYQADGKTSFGSSSVVYVSIPDSLLTCGNLGLPSLPAGWEYRCSNSTNYRKVDNTGWVPVPFTSVSWGSPLNILPIDPVNTTSTGNYYTYVVGGSWELTALFESDKFADKAINDGDAYPGVYSLRTSASPLTPGIRDKGLVGYWKFEETSGTLYDSSGYRNNGTQSGGVTYGATGKVGNALSFDGVDDYVNAGSNISLGSTALTVSVWVKYNSWGVTGSSRPYVSDWNTWSPGAQKGFLLRTYQNNTTPQFNVADGTNYYSISSSQSLTLNNWYHVVGVFKANEIFRIYIDGVQRGSTTAPSQYIKETSTPVYIGRSGINPGYFDGLIDEVRIYNRALSAAEISAIYNATK